MTKLGDVDAQRQLRINEKIGLMAVTSIKREKDQSELSLITTQSDPRPFHFQPCRAGTRQKKLIRDKVHKLPNGEVAEPALSEWASPVVFIPKKDGILQLCVDYCRLLSITVQNSYPIPPNGRIYQLVRLTKDILEFRCQSRVLVN